MPQGFGARAYQQWNQTADLCSFRVTVAETDLLISARIDLTGLALQSVRRHRTELEAYIQQHPEFQASFEPVPVEATAAPLIQTMAQTARVAGVGPFAAVAGAMAEAVGRDLLPFSAEMIVENGGDIFVVSASPRTIGIFAGKSPLTGKLGIVLDPTQMPCGICCSSGTVGHSISFGKADAAIVLAHSAALSDACATALGNRVRQPEDIPGALAWIATIEGVAGAVVIIGDKIGAWGQITLVKTSVNNQERKGVFALCNGYVALLKNQCSPL